MMKKMTKKLVALFLALTVLAGVPQVAGIPQEAQAAKTIHVLMIGNSMTMRKNNTTVSNFKKLASKGGHKVSVKYLAASGEKLKNWANSKHKNGKKAYKTIASRQWDYVVLQENTDYAIAHGSTFIKASKKLANYIKKECPDAQIIYNCTWAYAKTKTISGKKYSFRTQQKKMNANYLKAAKATDGMVSWSGKAFQKYRSSSKAKALYLKDKNHATSYGWYLNACCLYTTIFQETPAKAKYYAGLNKTHAKRMQKIAASVHGN